MVDNLITSSTKQIILPINEPPKKQIKPNEKKKRVVIQKSSWVFESKDYHIQTQRTILYDNPDSVHYKKLLQQIRNKIASYKSQDLEKGIYEPVELITIDQTIEKLKQCGLQCFYCKDGVLLIYEFVREPKQWTLERLDNGLGHTDTNTVISCLSCNLRRRTMHFDRYIETKQMACIIKVDSVGGQRSGGCSPT